MKPIEYKSKQVRLFLSLLLAFSVLAVLKFVPSQKGTVRVAIIAASAAVLLFFFFLPKLFFPIFRVILIVSAYIGNFIFLLISTFVFFLILTPLSWVMRLFGKRFMYTRIDAGKSSYYEQSETAVGYEHQY